MAEFAKIRMMTNSKIFLFSNHNDVCIATLHLIVFQSYIRYRYISERKGILL